VSGDEGALEALSEAPGALLDGELETACQQGGSSECSRAGVEASGKGTYRERRGRVRSPLPAVAADTEKPAESGTQSERIA